MKKLFGLGIFILIFMLSVGLCLGKMDYMSDISTDTLSSWEQKGSTSEVEKYVSTMTVINNTKENEQYGSADIYVLNTHHGPVVLAYRLHKVNGEELNYEMDVISKTYVEVESLEHGGFMERLELGMAIKRKILSESTQ